MATWASATGRTAGRSADTLTSNRHGTRRLGRQASATSDDASRMTTCAIPNTRGTHFICSPLFVSRTMPDDPTARTFCLRRMVVAYPPTDMFIRCGSFRAPYYSVRPFLSRDATYASAGAPHSLGCLPASPTRPTATSLLRDVAAPWARFAGRDGRAAGVHVDMTFVKRTAMGVGKTNIKLV